MGDLTNNFQKIKHRFMAGFVVGRIGEALLYIDDQHVGEAEDWIKKAIKVNST